MDKAEKQTEKTLSEMEKRLSAIYSKSYSEINEKWDEYMAKVHTRLEKIEDEMFQAQLTGDKDTLADLQYNYKRIMLNQTLQSKKFKAMSEKTASKISHINEIALEYINCRMPRIYSINYNQMGVDTEPIKGYSFTIYSEEAVKTLMEENANFLPPKKLNIPKDVRWNMKKLNSQIMQGIIQGETVPQVANRLMNVYDMNKKAAIRNARTMTTSAQNKGRQDSYERAVADGVVMEKVWSAGHDERTREWHIILDGVAVGVDKAFENDYGEIRYPGDPKADPANVYNCRCCLQTNIRGFRGANGRITYIGG